MRRARVLVSLAAVIATHAIADDDNTRARNIAANCASCHGTNGISKPGMPALAGRNKAELVSKMQDFKSGRVPSTIMGQIAKGYSDTQIELAAGYFAAQKP
jgi:sulfide dehydrogenase cytochrome subunit